MIEETQQKAEKQAPFTTMEVNHTAIELFDPLEEK